MATRAYAGKQGPHNVQGITESSWHRDQQKLLSPCEDVMTRIQRRTWEKIAQDRIDVWFGLEVEG